MLHDCKWVLLITWKTKLRIIKWVVLRAWPQVVKFTAWKAYECINRNVVFVYHSIKTLRWSFKGSSGSLVNCNNRSFHLSRSQWTSKRCKEEKRFTSVLLFMFRKVEACVEHFIDPKNIFAVGKIIENLMMLETFLMFFKPNFSLKLFLQIFFMLLSSCR